MLAGMSLVVETAVRSFLSVSNILRNCSLVMLSFYLEIITSVFLYILSTLFCIIKTSRKSTSVCGTVVQLAEMSLVVETAVRSFLSVSNILRNCSLVMLSFHLEMITSVFLYILSTLFCIIKTSRKSTSVCGTVVQ
uniref:Uncharacterized protein n=1 Tax=Rhodnius prolixus TaxID=13249 RepID=T1HJJ8_RHOPR